jgi:hypothetical protein
MERGYSSTGNCGRILDGKVHNRPVLDAVTVSVPPEFLAQDALKCQLASELPSAHIAFPRKQTPIGFDIPVKLLYQLVFRISSVKEPPQSLVP